MRNPFLNNVRLTDGYRTVMGGRVGTVFATYEELVAVIGPPQEEDRGENGLDGHGKVHYSWYFETPRGPVEVGDYWWNPAYEQSIRCAGRGHYWVKGFLRNHGIRCSKSNGKEI